MAKGHAATGEERHQRSGSVETNSSRNQQARRWERGNGQNGAAQELVLV